MNMQTDYAVFPERQLVIADAEGRLNLPNSQQALQTITSDPQFAENFEVLLDLRDVCSCCSVADVFELASSMEKPDSILPTHRKIAVVVSGDSAFEHAKFLELCAQNRGVRIRSFADVDAATAWLDADVEDDPVNP